MNEQQPQASSYDAPLSACPLCRQPALRAYDRDFRTHEIQICARCGVKLMNPQYSDAHLAAFYGKYINVHDQDRGANPDSKMDPARRAAGKRRSLELLAEHLPERGRILMVGCGDGLELQVGKETGWRPEGYDIDPATTAAVAERHGVPVYSGAFEDLEAPGDGFDAMFLDQVIEHPKNPGDYLASCNRLLRDGGVLFLGAPNIGSLSNRLKTMSGRLGLRRKRRGKHYNTRHHLFFFTPGVMARLLPRYGFECLEQRGSLKPQPNPFTKRLSRWFPNLDSSFLTLARKRGPVEAGLQGRG